MSGAALRALREHIERTGRYPPLVVRPVAAGRYQIIDGHHRARVLRELDHADAECDVWEVDDRETDLLLLTLNRLRGEDDPLARAQLVKRLSSTRSLSELARHLPESIGRLKRLLALNAPAPVPRPAPAPDGPHAITFFLSRSAHERLLELLRDVDRDRSTALVKLLTLEGEA